MPERTPVRPLTLRRLLAFGRRAREMGYVRAVEEMPVPTLRLSHEGVVKAVNSKAVELFHPELRGLRGAGRALKAAKLAEGIVGKSLRDLITMPEPDLEHLKQLLLKAAKAPSEEGHKAYSRITNVRTDGKQIETLVRVSARRTPSGEPEMLVSLLNTAPMIEKSRLLKDIFEINHIINSPRDVNVILDDLAQRVSKQLNAVCVTARPNMGNTLHLAGGSGIPTADITAYGEHPIGKGVIGVVAQTGKYLKVPNLRDWEHSFRPDLDEKYNLGEAVGIPLFGRAPGKERQLVGVLAVYKKGSEKFEPHEESLLQFIADNAAASITRAKLEEELRREAERMPVTGTYNRRVLSNKIAQHLGIKDIVALPEGLGEVKPFALLYLDADNLKRVNDLHGHDEGDEALKTIARILEEQAGRNAIVAQPSTVGDEFAVFLPGASVEQAEEIAAKVRGALQEKVKKNKKLKEARFGASIGVMAFGKGGETGEKYTNLDELYEAIMRKSKPEIHDLLTGVLALPESKMALIKKKSKRATGFIDAPSAFEDLARTIGQGKVPAKVADGIKALNLPPEHQKKLLEKLPEIVEKEVLSWLYPHTDRRAIIKYFELKRKQRQEQKQR